ncbi:carbohydrate kinase family protein [Neolewinella aurantiaca]|uniref:carbohydrate kinase family protein n=1 Tax=Neolewinella aurantiaca TaxID=2602767 RepID=UPI0016500F5B|nr:carbohydrate kinase family protein [Neolewinella aurantiaca]
MKHQITKGFEFYYDHPLKDPVIIPSLENLTRNLIRVNEPNGNILAFGMIESDLVLSGEKVVYDPQSTVRPISFKKNGSNAVELALVLNMSEAAKLSGEIKLDRICAKIFDDESCSLLIIKDGAKGAYLFDGRNSDAETIPVFLTDRVWTIGSGDIFSTMFATCWFDGMSAKESAHHASLATALYCNSKEISEVKNLSSDRFKPLHIVNVPSHQVYLAGPFFTMAERWIINETWKSLRGFGLSVFSPFHDVGLGKADDVVKKDIQGLDVGCSL